MTQRSGYWAGTSIGDAANVNLNAPYSDVEFADIWSKLEGSDESIAFIAPKYGANLRCEASSPTAMSVRVGTGFAFVKGRFYENDALETLTIATADATNPRLDRIVLRCEFSGSATAPQTIRLAVVTGTPAATPSLPALTSTSTLLEVNLAYVWVAAGVTTIEEAEIHDIRSFLDNSRASFYSREVQLLRNSEHMAFSCLNTIPAGFGSTQPPDMWEKVGTVTAYASATRPSFQPRGRAVQVTAGAANSGYTQSFPASASTIYTVVAALNVTAGDVGVLQVSDGFTTYTKNVRRTGSFLTEQIVLETNASTTQITVNLLCLNNTDIVQFGQTLANQGHGANGYREIRETIFFKYTIGDTNWNTTAKSSATTTIDLDADYQTLLLPGTKSVYLFAAANDSGSAAGTASLGFRHVGGISNIFDIRLNSETNDALRTNTGWIPVNVNNQFDIVVVATGAGTLDATARVVGIAI